VLNGTYATRGTLTVLSSTISSNEVTGVANFSGVATVLDSIIADNRYGGVRNGSFYYAGRGTLTVLNSTISGNSANSGGGGLFNGPGSTCTVTKSTISRNAISSGGGWGAGIANRGTCRVLDSTISGNLNSLESPLEGAGGGVANYGYATLTLLNSTISGNSAGLGGGVGNFDGSTLTLARTIIAGNIALDGPELSNGRYGYGIVRANAFNLFGVNGNAGVEGFTPGPMDVVPGPAVLLGEILDPRLSHNGGPTRTHALVRGSPAVDTSPTYGCPPPATDQRGFRRPVDGDTDGLKAPGFDAHRC
jgi:hypothetical protein